MILVSIVRRAPGSPWEFHWIPVPRVERYYLEGRLRPFISKSWGEVEGRMVTIESAREDYGVVVPPAKLTALKKGLVISPGFNAIIRQAAKSICFFGRYPSRANELPAFEHYATPKKG